MRTKLLLLALVFFQGLAEARFRVVTTTEDLASLTRSIGGDLLEVTSTARGTQDPHFIEAKPSYLVTLSRADLLIAIGLSLEQGWLPLLQRGARQPKLLPGNSGFLDVSEAIHPLEVNPHADRSEGDVHPFGNPHYMADPRNALLVAEAITKRLTDLDKENAAKYQAGLAALKTALSTKIADWKKRLAKFKGTKVVGYHKTFNYLFNFFGFTVAGYLEPKAGIPPTAQHILSLIQLVKKQKVGLIVMEDYFDEKAARSLSEQTGVKMLSLPAYTGGHEKAATYETWYEYLVSHLEKTLSSK